MSKLIIFDLDGVIFDSEKNMKKLWEEVMHKYKISQNFEKYRKFIGLPFVKILKNTQLKITIR